MGHTDVDVTEGGEALSEFLDLFLVGLDLLTGFVDTFSFFLDVESQVLKEEDGAF